MSGTAEIQGECRVEKETEEEIIINAQAHAKYKHAMNVTREQAWALAEPV